MNNVAVTGYFNTGSGAVINLLQEYSSVDDGSIPNYEHLFLYDVNGVFETIDKILFGNSLFNSNAAINNFRAEMKKLNEVDFGWFGGYKKLTGNVFSSIIDQFIADITEYYNKNEWYGTYCGRTFKLSQLIKDIAKFILQKKKNISNIGTTIFYDQNNFGEFSFATNEKLQVATKRLISSYINMFYSSNKVALINHLLTPQDAFRVDDYTPNELKLIIVDRDIRDVYIYNKYFLSKWAIKVYPTDMNEFIRFMHSYRKTERSTDSTRVLRIQFEDLIYNYEKTKQIIESFVGLDEKDHINQKQYLDVSKSIKNTQIFKMKKEYFEETIVLTTEFPDLIYNFPFDINTSETEMFFA